MIHIAICDDDAGVIEFIEQFLETVTNSKVEYDTFESGEDAWKYIQSQEVNYDLYFLDIEMKEMSGIELAKKIREKSQQALFVFVTGHSEYVEDAFDVVTFDYISKPISKKRLQYVMDKALKHLKVTKKNFVFEYRKNTFSIPMGQITHIDKSGRKAFVNTKCNEVYQANLTLDEIWKGLDENMFVQVHVSCIVNLNEIIKIVRDEITLKDTRKIYVGRAYCKEVKRRHLQYMKGQV